MNSPDEKERQKYVTSEQGKYQIIDEPKNGPLSKYALHPTLPFFAWMFLRELGTALFIFNAVALRGRQMWQEIALATLSYGIFWVLAPVLIYIVSLLQLSQNALDYLIVIPIAIGIWLAYKVFVSQLQSHEIREHYKEAALL